MKNLKVIALSVLAFITIASTVFVSCQKQQEIYSCNPEVNSKVTKMRLANQSISRIELVQNDIEEQFGIFRSLTNENKKRIFIEKVDFMILNYNLNENEKTHLNKLKTEFLPSFYDEDNAAYLSYENDWVSYAKSQLGWNDQKLMQYLDTWLTDNDVAAKPNIGGGSSGGGNTPDCNCLSDKYCDFFTSGQMECNNKNCNTKGGCGFFGGKTCIGRCWYKG